MCLPSEAETASNGGRLPSNVEPAPIKELVEHRQDLSALLQPAAWSTPARRNPSLALIPFAIIFYYSDRLANMMRYLYHEPNTSS